MKSTLNFGPDWLRALSSDGQNDGKSPVSPSAVTGHTVKHKLAEHRYGREEMLGLYAPADMVPPELELFRDLLRERCGQPLAFIAPSEEEERCQIGGVNSTLVLKLAGRGGNSGRGRGGVRPIRGRGRGESAGVYNRSLSSDDSACGRGEPSNRRPWVDPSNRASYDKGRGEGGVGPLPEQRNRLSSDGRPPSSWRSSNSSQDDDSQGGEWQTTGQTKQWRRSENGRSWRDSRDNDSVRSKSWNRNNHEWKSPSNVNSSDHLPEWCENGDDEGPGTFDSTGQFQLAASQSPDKKVADVFTDENSPTNNKRETSKQELHPTVENETTNLHKILPSSPNEENQQTAAAPVIPKTSNDSISSKQLNSSHQIETNSTDKQLTQSVDDMEMSLDFGHVKSIMDGLDSEEENEPVPSHTSDPSIVYVKKSSYGNVTDKGLEDWLYKDPRGEIQGPFSSEEMMEWFKAGYFNVSLLIRRVCDELFLPLGDVVKLWNQVPFADGGRLPPPITSQTLVQQQQAHQRQRLLEQQQQQQQLLEQQRLAELKQQQRQQILLQEQQQQQQHLLRMHEQRMQEFELQKQHLLQQQMRHDKKHVEQALLRDLQIAPPALHSDTGDSTTLDRTQSPTSAWADSNAKQHLVAAATPANPSDVILSSNRQEDQHVISSTPGEIDGTDIEFQSQLSRKQKKKMKSLTVQDSAIPISSSAVNHEAQKRAKDEMQLKHHLMLQRHQQLQELEHQRHIHASIQQQQQRQQQRPSTQDSAFTQTIHMSGDSSSWQAGAPVSSSAPSLLEIQRIEEKRQLALKKQERMRVQQQQQQQQQADQKSLPGWKATSMGHGTNSMLKIQQEEARRQQLRQQTTQTQLGTINKQQMKASPGPTPSGSLSPWNSIGSPPSSQESLNSNNNLFKADGSFWDDVMKTLPETEQAKQSANRSSNKISKKTKEEEAVERLFKETHDDSFTLWIEKNMPQVKQSVEVPTFIAFLKDIDSPKEIEEYVVSYLGKNEMSKLFLNEFLQRQHHQANKQNQPEQQPPTSDSMIAKQSNKAAEEANTQSSKKQAAKKKKKMQKLDPYLLGFSCNSGEDIVNRGGEIMKAEDAWHLKR